jgi:hypothetical protein
MEAIEMFRNVALSIENIPYQAGRRPSFRALFLASPVLKENRGEKVLGCDRAIAEKFFKGIKEQGKSDGTLTPDSAKIVQAFFNEKEGSNVAGSMQRGIFPAFRAKCIDTPSHASAFPRILPCVILPS